jgi:hypothetical protein
VSLPLKVLNQGMPFVTIVADGRIYTVEEFALTMINGEDLALSARLGPPSPNYEPLRRPRSAVMYQGHEYLWSFPTEIPPTEQQGEAACRRVLLMRQAPQRHRNVHFDAFV